MLPSSSKIPAPGSACAVLIPNIFSSTLPILWIGLLGVPKLFIGVVVDSTNVSAVRIAKNFLALYCVIIKIIIHHINNQDVYSVHIIFYNNFLELVIFSIRCC